MLGRGVLRWEGERDGDEPGGGVELRRGAEGVWEGLDWTLDGLDCM